MDFEIENVNRRPASNFSYGMYLLDINAQNLRTPFGMHLVVLGDIATGIKKKIEIPFGINFVAGGIQEEQIVVLALEYTDELTGKCILQTPWYFMWPNIKDKELVELTTLSRINSQAISNKLNQVESFKKRGCN